MTRPLRNLCEVAVVGGGLAGLSAARHLARLGRLATLFEPSGLYGGQVATVDHVYGLPTPGIVSGQDIAIPLLEDARKVGVQIVERKIATLEVGDRLSLCDDADAVYRPDAVIVASGAALRRLGIGGEEEYHGRGVSRCASCDGGFFRGQDVVVVGAGDAAVHEALVLARTSRQVFMVCRSAAKAKREYLDRLAAQRNVSFLWDTVVTAILGDGSGVHGVRLREGASAAVRDLPCSGVFPFIGVEPNGGWLPSALRTEEGLVATGDRYRSADPRIFAAGAARAGYDGNAIQAMAEGVGAAEAAMRYLAERGERR